MEASNTSNIVLPQEYLDSQFCSECFQYLTVPPITFHESGTICGRHDDLILSGFNSQVNTVLKEFQFPCVNRFDGCAEVLNFNISKEHEKSCTSVQRECQFCSFKGNWCQILGHVSKQHPLNLRRNGIFSFKLGSEWKQSFIYPLKDAIYIFTINMKCGKLYITLYSGTQSDHIIDHFTVKFSSSPKFSEKLVFADYGFFDNRSKAFFKKHVDELILLFGLGSIVYCQIVLETVTLSYKELQIEKKINFIDDMDLNLKEREKSLNELGSNIQKQQDVLSHRELEVEKKINYINDMNLNLEEREESLNALSSKIEKQQDSIEGVLNLCKELFCMSKFQCSICDSNITSNIYFCSKLHSCCKKCVTKRCKGCKDSTSFKQIEAFDKIVLTCDWPQCQKPWNIFDYLNHKSLCKFRPYKCPNPHCLEVLYSIPNLLEHRHLKSISVLKSNVLQIDDYGTCNIFWIIQNDLYRVSTNFSKAVIQVIIENQDVVRPVHFRVYAYNDSAGYKEITSDEFQIDGKFIFKFNNNNDSYGNMYKYRKLQINFK